MLPSEVLTCARDRIKDPANWIQGTYARTYNGGIINERLPGACKFCSVGALSSCQPTSSMPEDFLRRSLPAPYRSIVTYNDSRGRKHSEIMALFERAITLAKELEPHESI